MLETLLDIVRGVIWLKAHTELVDEGIDGSGDDAGSVDVGHGWRGADLTLAVHVH